MVQQKHNLLEYVEQAVSAHLICLDVGCEFDDMLISKQEYH